MTNEEILLEQLRTYDMPIDMKMDKLDMLVRVSDAPRSYEYAKEIIDLLTRKNLSLITNKVTLKRAVSVLRNAYTFRARKYFEDFLVAMEWNREPKERFYEPRRRILEPVVQDLQDLADDKLDVYGLSMPPRVGKTTIGLLYMCWLAGCHPEQPILASGYSSSLVKSFYEGCKGFVSDFEYTYTEIFPYATIADTSAKELTLDLQNKSRYKSLTFRSIDGSVTGATEARQLLYLDDLVSGIEEALNPVRMETLWNKVSSDLFQRKKDGCKLLVIGTRWSIHDPIGHIETKYENDPRAKFRKMKALDDEGNSNFIYDFNVGFNNAYYADMESSLDPVSWKCIFQQQPIEREGLLFPELKRYLTLPQDEPDDIFFWVDVAFGGADWLAMPIGYVYGEDVYIEDLVYMKGDYKTTEPVVTGKIVANKCRRGTFEANNGGDFYSRDVADMVRGQGYHCNITTKRAPTNMSKMSRIIQYSPDILNFYFKDASLIKKDSSYNKYLNDLCSYTQTGKNKHDDAPDSCAGLATLLRFGKMNKINFIDRKDIGI